MPVLVTAPETVLGTEVVRQLAELGGQVRAFGGAETPVAVFRRLGVISATGSLLDEGHLETAMEQVHTVVHLAVGPLVDRAERLVEETATVASAAVGAGVRRLITLSVPGAREAASDPLRAAAAEVEELVAAVPVPATILRTSLVDSDELRATLARAPLPRDVLDNTVAPLLPEDLARGIVWLDDRRTATLPDVETLAVDGPRTVTIGSYLRAVGVTPLSSVSRFIERVRPASGPDVVGLAGPWTSGRALESLWSRTGIEPGSPVGA